VPRWSTLTPDQQKQQLRETILRKLQKPSAAVAVSVPVASTSSSRSGDAAPREVSLDRATTKIQ
jgi:hypothetical protein